MLGTARHSNSNNDPNPGPPDRGVRGAQARIVINQRSDQCVVDEYGLLIYNTVIFEIGDAAEVLPKFSRGRFDHERLAPIVRARPWVHPNAAQSSPSMVLRIPDVDYEQSVGIIER